MSDHDVLFECDFSVDELAVLADLLEIPALPGVDPETQVPDEAKGAAARGLLARGVLVADGSKGTVEITQPYATLISVVLMASSAWADSNDTVRFASGNQAVSVSPRHAGLGVTWTLSSKQFDASGARAEIVSGSLTITPR